MYVLVLCYTSKHTNKQTSIYWLVMMTKNIKNGTFKFLLKNKER